MTTRQPLMKLRVAGLGLAALMLLALPLAHAPRALAEDVGEERVGELELPAEAERAINRALAFLAASQNADGSWGGSKYYVSNTSLVVMAFMVQGHVPGKGQYGGHLERGIDYLVNQSQLRADGYIIDESSGVFYQHCLAVMALAEAWGHSKDPRIGPAVRKGTQVILRSQGRTGGWRYSPQPTGGDISVSVMAVEALVSAKESGIMVPDKSLEKARNFMYACQSKEGFFTYMPGKDETNSYRMGAGLLSLQLMGDRDSEAVKKGWAYLLGPGVAQGWAHKARGDWLDQFYCVQACYQGGDEYIQFWYPRIMQKILEKQEPSGKIGGGGNLPHGATAVATLILGVPYRYLPIFQR